MRNRSTWKTGRPGKPVDLENSRRNGANTTNNCVNLREELGQVDVHDGFEKEDGFVLKWKPEFEVSGGGQDRLDGSHAVVVMRLR